MPVPVPIGSDLGDDLPQASVEGDVVRTRSGRVTARPGLMLADGRREGGETALGDLAVDRADQPAVRVLRGFGSVPGHAGLLPKLLDEESQDSKSTRAWARGEARCDYEPAPSGRNAADGTPPTPRSPGPVWAPITGPTSETKTGSDPKSSRHCRASCSAASWSWMCWTTHASAPSSRRWRA